MNLATFKTGLTRLIFTENTIQNTRKFNTTLKLFKLNKFTNNFFEKIKNTLKITAVCNIILLQIFFVSQP